MSSVCSAHGRSLTYQATVLSNDDPSSPMKLLSSPSQKVNQSMTYSSETEESSLDALRMASIYSFKYAKSM